MCKTLILSSLVLITTGLAAQSSTVPSGYDSSEGESYQRYLLGYTPARQQSFYLPKATGWTGPKVIKSLWMRADGAWSQGLAFKCDIMVEVSSKGIATDPKKTSPFWNKNHGTDKKIFMKKKSYNIPSFTRVVKPPHKWMIELKGDAPFVDANKQLCVDTRVYTPKTQRNFYWFVDAATSNTYGFYRTYGAACNPSNFYNYASGYNRRFTLRTYGYARHRGEFVLSWLGSKRLNLSVGGGCSLYSNVAILHPSPVKTTSVNGYASFIWGVVPSSAIGLVVFSQMAAITSSGTLRWSRGTEIHIGSSPIYYNGFSVYNYAYGSQTFNPDTGLAKLWSSSVIIHDVR